MKLSIVLSTQPTQFQAATFSGNLDSNLQQISRLGYDGAELTIRDPRLVDGDVLEAAVRKYNLQVPAIGTGQAWGEEGLSFTDPDPAVRKTAIERIKSHIPIAARFEAVIIIGLIRGIVKPGIEHKQAMDWLIEALRECCQTAGQSGVRLALEPINRHETTLINTVQQGMDLVSQVGAENFGLLLDTYHMNIEEPNIEKSIQLCKKRIFHFHVADSNRWYTGAGHLDFYGIFKALMSTGYQGFVSGEFLAEPDALIAAKENIVHLKAIFKHLLLRRYE